jgi:hypothetical protein
MDIPLAGLKERRLTQAGLTWETYDRAGFILEKHRVEQGREKIGQKTIGFRRRV